MSYYHYIDSDNVIPYEDCFAMVHDTLKKYTTMISTEMFQTITDCATAIYLGQFEDLDN